MDDRRQTHAPERIGSFIARCLSADAAAVSEIDRHGLWEYVASQACSSGLGGALIQALCAQELDIPASAAMQLDAYRDHVVAANAYKVSRTEPLLARLQADNVPFLLLKGAALNAVLYDDPAARAMVDVDILIRRRDADRVDHLLIESGCSRGADLVRADFYPRYYYEREYFTPHSPPVKIDLHVRPLRPLRYGRTIPEDALWDRPQRAAYGAITVTIPSAENMLIHLAAHATCHGLGELKWLYDIKRWLDRFGGQINVAELADKCRRFKIALPVQRGLTKALTVFGQPTPVLTDAIRAVTQPAGWRDRLTLAQAPRDDDHPAAALLVNLVCTPGVRFRVGYLKSVLIPGPAHLAQLYHRRHVGWTIVAHLLRVLRSLTRPLLPATPQPV